MCNIDVFRKFSLHFCVIFIIVNVACMNRIYAKNLQRAEIYNATVIEVATSSSVTPQPTPTLSTNMNSHLATQLKAFRGRIKTCIELTKDSTWNCLKSTTLYMFDKLTTAAVIPIWSGIRFVRQNNKARNYKIEDEITNRRQDLQHITWFDALAMRLSKILESHVLQLNLKEMTEAYMNILEKKDSKLKTTPNEARSRRHRFNMMITMMFGVTALGAVMVPLGFQILSVVSGKALLLAKMALLLASINGLKKVANSGVHYGLYQVPGDHYGGYYDRGDAHHPRNVASLAVEPVEFVAGK